MNRRQGVLSERAVRRCGAPRCDRRARRATFVEKQSAVFFCKSLIINDFAPLIFGFGAEITQKKCRNEIRGPKPREPKETRTPKSETKVGWSLRIGQREGGYRRDTSCCDRDGRTPWLCCR